MADEADRAKASEEMLLKRLTARRKDEAPKTRGTCLYCGEEGIEGRWCPGVDCRDAWEEEQRRRA